MLLCLCAAWRNTATKTRQLRGGPIGKCHHKGGDNDIHFAQYATLLELYATKTRQTVGWYLCVPLWPSLVWRVFFPKLSIIERRQKPMAGQLTLLASNSPGFWALGGPTAQLAVLTEQCHTVSEQTAQKWADWAGLGQAWIWSAAAAPT